MREGERGLAHWVMVERVSEAGLVVLGYPSILLTLGLMLWCVEQPHIAQQYKYHACIINKCDQEVQKSLTKAPLTLPAVNRS